MNNKGTTIVEIIVSITLISIVLIFIFNLLSSLKNEDYLSNARIEDSLKRTEIIHIIQNDFIYKGLKKVEVYNCNNKLCADFSFEDDTIKELEIDRKQLVYDDEIWNINGEYLLGDTQLCVINNNFGYYMFKLIIPETHDVSSYRKLSIDLIYLSNKNIEFVISPFMLDGKLIGGNCI